MVTILSIGLVMALCLCGVLWIICGELLDKLNETQEENERLQHALKMKTVNQKRTFPHMMDLYDYTHA